MELTKEFKKLYVEFFSRSAIVVFSVGFVAPFVAGRLIFTLAIFSAISIIICLLISSAIALTIKEKEA